MYKVFINEKKLLLSDSPQPLAKTLAYEGTQSIEIALDLLFNTSTPELNLYCDDLEKLWAAFRKNFKIIEAAGGIVLNAKGEMLFIHRLGKWDLPKGKIEKNESRESAALREVEEETGLRDLELKQFLNATYHIYTERKGENVLKATYWFLMNYNGTGNPVPQTDEGIVDAGWKNPEFIEKEILPTTFRNIVLILKDYQSLKTS